MAYSDYMANYMQQRRKRRRSKFIELLGGKCVTCGSTEQLQFDHSNPGKKEFDLNSIKDGRESVILQELKKCVLLCAKCHHEKSLANNDYVNRDKKPSSHGRVWHYKRYKCRCGKCRRAMRMYNLRRNKAIPRGK